MLFTRVNKDTQALPISIEDWEQKARELLPDGPFDYIVGGSGAEETLVANRSAFSKWAIVPRMLRDVSQRSLRIELFGQQLMAPLFLAPVGMQAIAHPDGELATARAAAAAGVPMVVSTISAHTLEQIAETMDDAPRWFQLYWSNDREVCASMVKRAEAGAISTLDTLPAITEAVDGRIPVLLDSGIRTGADVVKAIALGASAVMIGRPFMFGLAVAGEKGVASVLDTLLNELDVSVALSGSNSVADLNRSILVRL